MLATRQVENLVPKTQKHGRRDGSVPPKLLPTGFFQVLKIAAHPNDSLFSILVRKQAPTERYQFFYRAAFLTVVCELLSVQLFECELYLFVGSFPVEPRAIGRGSFFSLRW